MRARARANFPGLVYNNITYKQRGVRYINRQGQVVR